MGMSSIRESGWLVDFVALSSHWKELVHVLASGCVFGSSRRKAILRAFGRWTHPTLLSVSSRSPQPSHRRTCRRYWKEHCFGLTAETLVDKAMMLTHLGGTFGGNQQPTKFLCLVLKMLQIQPEKEIIIEFIKNEDYK